MYAFCSWFLSMWLLGAPAHAAKVPKADFNLKLDNYEIQLMSYPFPSGLHVIFQEEHSQPIVAVTTVFDHGSEADPQGMEGIAHVVEHLAFRARHGDLPKNMDLIKQLGGNFNASTSQDWTNYMTIAPRDALEALLAIEARRMKDGVANVVEEDVKLEIEIARNEKRMRYENAALGAAWAELGSMLFPEGHPYTRTTIGTHDSLSNINLKAVQDFVATNYVPADTTMVVVGDFELKDAFGILLRAFEQDIDLLMNPEDKVTFNALTEPKEQNAFLDEWVNRLGDYIQANAGQGAKQRVDCSKRAEPPAPPTQEIRTAQGMVDTETIVIAWSTPGGYCGDNVIGNIAASQLTNYIYQTIVPSWEWSNEEQSVEGLGCFFSPDEYAGMVVCYIEPAEGYEGKRLADKAADALYMQWDRETLKHYPAFMNWSLNNAKMGGLSGVLSGVDEVAALYGRATATAMDAHFTGDVRYFSRSMEEINSVEIFPVQEFARKYLTRNRMVTLVVEPMDEEERARREASARSGEEGDQDYHASSREDKIKTVFTLADMRPEMVANQVVVPDRTNMREVTLDNGMSVVIYPYGEAPLVQTMLVVGGSSNSSTEIGLNGFSEVMHARGTKIPETDKMLAVAGSYGESGMGDSSVLIARGASGNLDALLSKLRRETGEVDWQMARKSEWIKSKIKSSKSAGKKDPAVWASRLLGTHLWPDHAYGAWATPEYYERMWEWDLDDVQGWVHRKYQPANSKLVVVGKIPDLDAAEQTVRDFFESWQPKAGVEVGPVGKPMAPTKQGDQKVMLFDKPTATQAEVTLACQLEPWTPENRYNGKILGDVLSAQSWVRLRERSGVTYGAYAYNASQPGGANALYISGLFQNDATELALKTFLALVDEATNGEIDEEQIATAKWSRARKTVLSQQSSSQMASMIANSVESGMGLDELDQMPVRLSTVSRDDLVGVIAPCKGHEVITVVGPVEYTEPAAKALGLSYEVVDWEKHYQEQLSEKELKKYLKKKAKNEAKKAKEEAEAAADEGEGA